MIAKTFLAVSAGGEPFLFGLGSVGVNLFLPVVFRAVEGNDWTATQKGVATCNGCDSHIPAFNEKQTNDRCLEQRILILIPLDRQRARP